MVNASSQHSHRIPSVSVPHNCHANPIRSSLRHKVRSLQRCLLLLSSAARFCQLEGVLVLEAFELALHRFRSKLFLLWIRFFLESSELAVWIAYSSFQSILVCQCVERDSKFRDSCRIASRKISVVK